MSDMLRPEVRRPVQWTAVETLQKVSLIPRVVTVEAPHEKVRISTSDLKIASIVLVNNALLLTRNTSDFDHVPGLRIENWL